MLIDTFLRSVVYPSKWLPSKFTEVFAMIQLPVFILSQGYAQKQTSEVQLQEEINQFKMNYQIEKQTNSKVT